VYLQTFLYIEEGLPDMQDSLINFAKRRKQAALLSELCAFQDQSYLFQPVPEIIDFIMRSRIMSEAEMTELTFQYEPSKRKYVQSSVSHCRLSLSLSLSLSLDISSRHTLSLAY
jgi:oligoribonuclease (3'-5' exoribonuclease)